MKSQNPINNVLIIGFGHHAKRIHFPVVNEIPTAKVVGIVDLESQATQIKDYLGSRDQDISTLFFEQDDHYGNIEKLSNFAMNLHINSVIISTGPDTHTLYAKWALQNGYCVLMDKPIHAENDSAHNIEAANTIHKEYESLLAVYDAAKSKFPYLACEVLSQRRHHPAYKIIKNTISEIYSKTNCPITYYYAFHNDGQWRMPKELSQIKYHGFDNGYGKASHSGYHFYDLINWFTVDFRNDKKIDKTHIKSWANYPSNLINQVDSSSLNKVFGKDIATNNQDLSNYGEIDVMSTIRLMSGNYYITHAQIDLLHSGLSTRSWSDIGDRNLYKGNGRIRHEQHYLSIGPFASISLTSWQSKPFAKEESESKNIFLPGHEFNLDITICRNTGLIGGLEIQLITLKDIYDPTLNDYSRGHQEDARRSAIIEFNNLVNSRSDAGDSSLESHYLSSHIMSSVYESLATNSVVEKSIKDRS